VSLLPLIQWLNETPISVYLRESELAFPLTEAIHLIGLAISVGAIMWVDLRLIGLTMRRERVSDVVSRMEPWAVCGFAVMFVSGLLLFLGKPENYYNTTAFRIKVLLLPLAGLNVLYFHKSVYPHVGSWDDAEVIPRRAKIVGCVSATLWVVIIVLGRWTAYFADELFGRAK
jgi:putative copper export protein